MKFAKHWREYTKQEQPKKCSALLECVSCIVLLAGMVVLTYIMLGF